MKNSLRTTLILAAFTPYLLLAQLDSVNVQWLEISGGRQVNTGSNGIGLDAQLNIYSCGYFSGTVSFGNNTFVSTGTGVDLIMTKRNNAGQWLWSSIATSSMSVTPFGIVTDETGNSFICGAFEDSLTLGSTILTSAGAKDIFIAKIDSSGQWLWAQQAGGAAQDYALSIAVDHNGGIYLTGYFSDTAYFGGDTLFSQTNQSFFLAKCSPSGQWLWTKSALEDDLSQGASVAIDSNLNIYLTGRFGNLLRLGNDTLQSSANTNSFVAKFDSLGNYLWGYKATGTTATISESFARSIIYKNGLLYIGGNFQGLLDAGDTVLTSINLLTPYLLTLDTNGNYISAKRLIIHTLSILRAMTIDHQENLYVTGQFIGTANFGGISLTSAGANDIFFAKYKSSGELEWASRAGGLENIYASTIIADNQQSIYVGGHYSGTIEFGHFSESAEGISSEFVAKMNGFDLSVQRAEPFDNLRVYPNPFLNEFNVKLMGIQNPAQISLFDLQGRMILTKTEQNQASTIKINLEGYPSGMYVLEIRTGAGSIRKKLIKQ